MYTIFNVLIVSWVSRFLRCVEAWNELEPLFRTKVTLTLTLTPNPNPNPDPKKGMQIWSAMDGIGSLTDPVEFLHLVTIAKAESKNNHERQRQVVMITLTLNLTPTLTLTRTPCLRSFYPGDCYAKPWSGPPKNAVIRGACVKTRDLLATSTSTMYPPSTGDVIQLSDGKPFP